jgi:surface antigen
MKYATHIKLTSLAIILTLATGCDALDNSGTKRTIGLLGGAGVGGLLGSKIGNGSGQLAATAAGTLLGAFLGSQIGSSLDKADKAYAAEAERQAVSRGQRTRWKGADGNWGEVRVLGEDYEDYAGFRRACREYQHTIYVGGRAERGIGRACQQADGSWDTAT